MTCTSKILSVRELRFLKLAQLGETLKGGQMCRGSLYNCLDMFYPFAVGAGEKLPRAQGGLLSL